MKLLKIEKTSDPQEEEEEQLEEELEGNGSNDLRLQ